MTRHFDLVAIGTGAAAATAAHRCRAAGWEVAVIDSRPFGGTCALRGCDPKRVLIGAADALAAFRRLQGKGIGREPGSIVWPELMSFKRSFTGPVPADRERRFAAAGIAAFHGQAHFTAADRLEVGGQELSARKVLIGSGARPADLHLAGGEHLTTSDQFLELDALPARIVFVGGGYISFELAHLAARAGAEVVVVHGGERPLRRFDPDLVDLLVEGSRAAGIRVELGTRVERIAPSSGGLAITARRLGEQQLFEADLVVHGGGRVPDLSDLDLGVAGIAASERGVEVDEYLQSVSHPDVYAAGDAAAAGPEALPLTPVAAHQGAVAAANLLHGNHRRPDYSGLATVAFTLPPLARAGLLAEEAHDLGLEIEVHRGDASSWYSTRRLGETHAAFKLLVEKSSGRLAGAHLLGPGAEEVINLCALAIRAGLPASRLEDALFAYPTHGYDLRYMLGA